MFFWRDYITNNVALYLFSVFRKESRKLMREIIGNNMLLLIVEF